MKKLVPSLALGALAAFALVACGSSSSSTSSSSTTASTTTPASTGGAGGGGGSSSGGSTVSISADPSGALAYQEKTATAKAGQVTVDFTNMSPVGHNVTIQDSSGKDLGNTDTITGSKTSTSVDLKPGTYTFFCSVDSHEQAGMKGTLTVN